MTGMYSTSIFLGSFVFLHSSRGAVDVAQIGNGSLTNNTPNGIFSCEWKDLEFSITYGPAIACVLAILVGGFQVFVGYKYQRTTLFIAGFAGAGLLTYIICLIKSSLALHYVLLITTAVGIFAGILCTTVKFVGLFTVGLSAGFCIAMGFLLGFVSVYQYHTIAVPFGVICGLAVVMAGATVWWKRVLLIISSSVFGGALIMGGIDYFIEDFWLLIYGYKRAYIMTVYGKPCVVSWIILSIWPVISVVGLLVQFLKTGRKPVSPKKGERRSYHSHVSQSLQNNIV